MILQGTLVNVAAVAAGCLIGRLAGRRISASVRRTLMCALGLATVLIGLELALKTRQPMVVIGSLILGGVAGEILGVEARLEALGTRLQQRFSGAGRVAEGFVSASLLYCVGAMAITGSLQDGMGQTPTILYAKSALDGVASVALTSTLGVGVAFSIVPLLLYQGGMTLLAGLASRVLTEAAMTEMNAVGGLLIVGIALDLLEIRRIPVGNLLPGLPVALGLMWGFGLT